MKQQPVVLITGALTGIGEATARAFAQQKARVVVSGRNEELGRALSADIAANGAEAEFILCDVRKDTDVATLVDATLARFGRLDVAVNNASTGGTSAPIVDQDPQSFAAAFDTNVLGTLLSLKYELRAMLQQGSGSIINVSSTVGDRGAPNVAVYAASKHAVEGLTKSAALEAAPGGVRVNAVAPGFTETAMLRRIANTPEKLKHFAKALRSSAYVTSTTWPM